MRRLIGGLVYARLDPFGEVWAEIETLLKQDSGLQAKTVWEELNRREPGRFSAGQLRTLQRRFLDWRYLDRLMPSALSPPLVVGA